MIYGIGDSHIGVFEGSPEVVIHYVGPTTAYQLMNPKSTSEGGKKVYEFLATNCQYKKGTIILSFGEIDCRLHIYRHHMETGKPISLLIAYTVANYARFIVHLEKFNFGRLAILGVPPVGTYPNSLNLVHFAARPLRADITRRFNNLMARVCNKAGWSYLDLYPLCSDEDGFMKDDLAQDDVHCKKTIAPQLLNALAVSQVN